MPDLFFEWTFWYLVGGAVVVVAAALLITVLIFARGIAAEATRALEACRIAEANTRAVRDLAAARETLESIRDHADGIEATAGTLAGALHGETGPLRGEAGASGTGR